MTRAFPYYEPQLRESMPALRSLIENRFAKEGVDGAAGMLAQWFAQQYMPDEHDLIPAAKTPESLKAFDDALKTTAPDVADWWPVGSTAFSVLSEPQPRDTRQVLGLALHELCATGAAIPPLIDLAATLQHKFEVFGRIVPRYTADWRKASDHCADCTTHHLLGLFLAEMYGATNDPRYLSTALKVADVVPITLPFIETLLDAVTALALLHRTEHALHHFYERHEFRLPAHG